MRHSKCGSRRSSPSRSVLRRLMRCDCEHLQGSRDRTRKVIEQIPRVEVQFVEKHVSVHRVKHMPARRCRASSNRDVML